MFGKPGFSIETEISRPPRASLDELSKFQVAVIGDGLGRQQIVDSGIKPLHRTMSLCGPAITVELHPADNLMIHAALKIAQEGDVLVINARRNTDYGVWGEITTSLAIRKKLGGMIIDGAVRDSVELTESDFPIFCRGVGPLGAGKEGPGKVNAPTSCGGVCVAPGDVVIGDGDGIVVVSQGLIQDAIDGATMKVIAEEKRLESIRNGPADSIYPEWLIPTLRAKGILKEHETI